MLADTGLNSSGVAASKVGGSLVKRDANADNLVIYYPLQTDLIDQKGGSDGTISRSTTGTYIDGQSNLVKTATANNPRFERGGLLLESAATQYLLHTNDPSNAAWSLNSNVTLSQDGTIAPDGNATAWKVQATANGAAYIAQDRGANAANSMRYWAKKGNIDEISHSISSDTIVDQGSNDNVALTDEWQEIDQAAASASDTALVACNADRVSGSATAGDYFYFWECNIQDTDFPTSTINSTTTATTRNAESCVLDHTNLPAWGDPQTIEFDFIPMGDRGGNQQLFIVTGDTNPRAAIMTAAEVLVLQFGSNQISSGAGTLTYGQKHTAKMVSDGANFEGFLDGVSLGTAAVSGVAGTPSAITLNGGVGYFNISEFKVWNV